MKIAVCTAASGKKHQSCLPLFALSLRVSYPEYALRLFSVGELDEPVKAALEMVGGANVVLDEREFVGYCDQPRIGAVARFLVFTPARWERFFSEFDAVYITDCDMFIAREEPPLHVQHTTHCEAIGLPYSDLIRSCHCRCMTGLLFCLPEFQKQVAETCERFDAIIRTEGLYGLGTPGHIQDEWMLREMVEQAGIGLPPQWEQTKDPSKGVAMGEPVNCKQAWFRPWHGINLGWTKQVGGLAYAKQTIQEQPSIAAAMRHLMLLWKHPDFQVAYDVLTLSNKTALDIWQEAYDQVRSEQ